MASVNYALDVSDHADNLRPSQARPVDLVHLAKQTMGDRELENEVLLMFVRNARRALEEIGAAELDCAGKVAHRLKGAAAAIGAFGVSQAAARVEADAGHAGYRAALVSAVMEAESFIEKLCR